MSCAVTIDAECRVVHLPLNLQLDRDEGLSVGQLAFEQRGPADAPVVIVQGGISAGRHVAATRVDPRAGWWEPMVGPGRAVDTTRFRVLSFDFLGGEGASSGPSNRGGSFPRITPKDQARALIAALDTLGVERAQAFAGASYGGMVGLCLAELAPGRLEKLLMLCAAHRPHPLATAWRSIQRDIVRLGAEQGRSREALAIARALAVTTYRSAKEFDARFAWGSSSNDVRFDVQEYLEHQGDKFSRVFSPEAFLRLSESIDLQAVEPERVTVPTTLVGADTDVLVPWDLMCELRDRLAGPVKLIELRSDYGHDAFLKEEEKVAAIVSAFLTEVV